MQMLSNFITGTENLFKLLFVNGILIILIGLFYPLQKRDELDLKIIEHNSHVILLNRDIKELLLESEVIKDEIKSEYKSKKTTTLNTKASYNLLKNKVFEQDKKILEIANQQKMLEVLKIQQKTYDNYCKAFLVFGGLITVIGLIGWSRLTYFMYDKEYLDFKNRKLAQSKTSTTRWFNFKAIFWAIVSIIIFVAILFYIVA